MHCPLCLDPIGIIHIGGWRVPTTTERGQPVHATCLALMRDWYDNEWPDTPMTPDAFAAPIVSGDMHPNWFLTVGRAWSAHERTRVAERMAELAVEAHDLPAPAPAPQPDLPSPERAASESTLRRWEDRIERLSPDTSPADLRGMLAALLTDYRLACIHAQCQRRRADALRRRLLPC